MGRPDPRKAWDAATDAPQAYTAGTWGPSGAIALIERDGRTWHEDDALMPGPAASFGDQATSWRSRWPKPSPSSLNAGIEARGAGVAGRLRRFDAGAVLRGAQPRTMMSTGQGRSSRWSMSAGSADLTERSNAGLVNGNAAAGPRRGRARSCRSSQGGDDAD